MHFARENHRRGEQLASPRCVCASINCRDRVRFAHVRLDAECSKKTRGQCSNRHTRNESADAWSNAYCGARGDALARLGAGGLASGRQRASDEFLRHGRDLTLGGDIAAANLFVVFNGRAGLY